MKVKIKTLTGKLVEITPNDGIYTTIYELKEQLQIKEGLPPDMQRLTYSGHQLDNEYVLEHYGITDGSMIYLITQLRGD